MGSRFSDVFSSDSNDQNADSSTNTDQNADGGADASNSGISVNNESSSRDEDGEMSHDSTGADTGNTDLGSNLDLDNMVDNMSGSSNSSDDTSVLD